LNTLLKRAMVKFSSHGEPDIWLWSFSSFAAGSPCYCSCLCCHHCLAPPSCQNPCPKPCQQPAQANARHAIKVVAPRPLPPLPTQRVRPLLDAATHFWQPCSCKSSRFHDQLLTLKQPGCLWLWLFQQLPKDAVQKQSDRDSQYGGCF